MEYHGKENSMNNENHEDVNDQLPKTTGICFIGCDEILWDVSEDGGFSHQNIEFHGDKI